MTPGDFARLANICGFQSGGGGGGSTTNMQYLNKATGWPTPLTNLGTAQLLTQVQIPAGAMSGTTSQLDLFAEYTITTGSSNNKTIQITDASSGTVLANIVGAFSSSSYLGLMLSICNRDATNVQYARATTISNPFATGGGTGVVPLALALDFTVARTLNFYVTMPATITTDTVKLERYRAVAWL